MKIPKIFFGKLSKVKAETNKVLTKLKKGTGDTLFYNKRFSFDEQLNFRNILVEYFYSTPWGVIILNGSENFEWIMPDLTPFGVGMNPDNVAKVLEGTCQFWDLFMSLNDRFYTGGVSRKKFIECQPLCYYLLTRCGFDRSEFPVGRKMNSFPPPPAWGDVKKICVKHKIIYKLKHDDEFREKAQKDELFVLRPYYT